MLKILIGCREGLCYVPSRSVLSNSKTPWIVACQAPLSLGIRHARIVGLVAMTSSRESSQPRDQTEFSHIASRFFTIWASRETHREGQPVPDYWILNQWIFFLIYIDVGPLSITDSWDKQGIKGDRPNSCYWGKKYNYQHHGE